MSDADPVPFPGQPAPDAATPEEFKVTVAELVKYVAASNDIVMKTRLKNVLLELGQTQAIKDCLRQALGLLMKNKFGPLRVTTDEINKLPAGWDIQLTPKNQNLFEVAFYTPAGSSNIILLNGR